MVLGGVWCLVDGNCGRQAKSPTCADRLGFLLGVNVRRRADSMSYRLWSARMGLVGIKATNLKRQHFLSPLVSSI